jgi:hypothetical protein
VVPVAVLGTDTFDATQIDPGSILLEGVAPLRWSLEDVSTPAEGDSCPCSEAGPDGIVDLTLKFPAPALIEAIGPVEQGDVVELTLTGALLDGTAFEATDCMVIVGNVAGKQTLAAEAQPWGKVKSLYR